MEDLITLDPITQQTHSIDPTVILPDENFLFKTDFEFHSPTCVTFYSTFMRMMFLAVIILCPLFVAAYEQFIDCIYQLTNNINNCSQQT